MAKRKFSPLVEEETEVKKVLYLTAQDAQSAAEKCFEEMLSLLNDEEIQRQGICKVQFDVMHSNVKFVRVVTRVATYVKKVTW